MVKVMSEKICQACKGQGYIIECGKKKNFWNKDPWNYSGNCDGNSYHVKVCKKCYGSGEIPKSL